MMRKLTTGAAGIAAMLIAAPVANAAIIYNDGFTAPYTATYHSTTETISVNFNSAGGSSPFSFDLIGGDSLDGVNCCTDVFHLSLNGIEIFSGSFNLGGGGTNSVITDLVGFTLTGLNNDPATTWLGGSIGFAGVLTNLLVGMNNLTFSYSGSDQGTGDESWGINNASVSTVPLPPAALLLVSGLAGIAGLNRRRKNKAA